MSIVCDGSEPELPITEIRIAQLANSVYNASMTSSQTKNRKAKRSSQTTSVGHTNTESTAEHSSIFRSSTFRWSVLSAVAIWLAFPPAGLWPLAWIAPYGWVRLIRLPKLDGARPRLTVYLVAYAHWILMTQWLRLPHWAAGIGWFFLAAYLAIYLYGFIFISRWLVHRTRVSSVIAVPLVWTAMEVARSYLFTGWAIALLSHSQVPFVPVLQIASWTGAYGVSFVVMLVAAAIERTVNPNATAGLADEAASKIAGKADADSGANDDLIAVAGGRRIWWPLVLAGAVLASVLGFGMWSLDSPGQANTSQTDTRQNAASQTVSTNDEVASKDERKRIKVAIIQGDLDTVFGGSNEPQIRSFRNYERMSKQAVAEHQVELVIWPESMFSFNDELTIINYDEELKEYAFQGDPFSISENAKINESNARKTLSGYRTHFLVGTSTRHIQRETTQRFNTAAFYGANGELADSYHKNHPVMFGEYVPFGEMFPWLYKLTPMGAGLSRGKTAKAFEVNGVTFCPNICFENTVPHLIRRHIADLEQETPVDVLVTLTNDGWFWGSSLLDLHLACGIFRAVEHRKPMLIAANTGFSAHIDRYGRVLGKGPRQESGIVIANVTKADAQDAATVSSAYTRWGDAFGHFCVLFTLAGVLIGCVRG